MPREIFAQRNELFSPDEPFCVLEQGRAETVRVRASDAYIPPDTAKWFRGGDYQDYYALPATHQQRFLGAVAWATKLEKGFHDDHLEIFHRTLPGVVAVLRLHTNDLVVRDLTIQMEEEIASRTADLHEANQKLSQLNERLASQSEQQLRQFAQVSHEIRTPLNCVVGMSSLMCDEIEPLVEENPALESIKESVLMIYNSGDLLKAVVDDVLDYSKLQSGNFEVALQDMPVRQTLHFLSANLMTKLQEKQLGLSISVDESVPDDIYTDPRRLQQVLFNILGNACKFSKEKGCVHLAVDRFVDVPLKNQDMIRFRIKDYGRGIEPSHLTKVFEPFSKASKQTQASYGGTGLGLSISSKIVTRLGGRISVDSVLGAYTEFIVVLPVSLEEHTPVVVERRSSTCRSGSLSKIFRSGPSPARRLSNTNTRSDRYEASSADTLTDGSDDDDDDDDEYLLDSLSLGSGSSHSLGSPSTRRRNGSHLSTVSELKILYAEDNTINQKIMKKILQRIGVRSIDTVENGSLAVERALSQPYNIIFMDMEMPVMDGLEATTEILKKSSTPPPIYFVTANALEDFRCQAAEAGATGFISKPFQLKRIKSLIQHDMIEITD